MKTTTTQNQLTIVSKDSPSQTNNHIHKIAAFFRRLRFARKAKGIHESSSESAQLAMLLSSIREDAGHNNTFIINLQIGGINLERGDVSIERLND